MLMTLDYNPKNWPYLLMIWSSLKHAVRHEFVIFQQQIDNGVRFPGFNSTFFTFMLDHFSFRS